MRLSSSSWTTAISEEYDLLGPFPVSAREQQQISPSYPLKVVLPYAHDPSKTYPSALSKTGTVHWDRQKAKAIGAYDIVYPDVRWNELRNILGWSVLQHHSVLHTTVTITPPADHPRSSTHLALRINVKQASFIAFAFETLHWFEGDIYDQSHSPRLIPLPEGIPTTRSSTLDVFISVDYEIRLFGDPAFTAGRSEPVSSVQFMVEVVHLPVISLGSRQIIPDFVDGTALGDVVGLELQNGGLLQSLEYASSDQGNITFTFDRVSFAPFQQRMIPLLVKQTAPLPPNISTLRLTLTLSSGALAVDVPLKHHIDWRTNSDPNLVFRQTHRRPIPSESLLRPPFRAEEPRNSTLVALHGAGVDPLSPWWSDAIPRQERSWVVYPSGLGPWGYDWRGPSARDVFAALASLNAREPHADNFVIIGHSNGGQGTNYISSHYPDRAHSLIPVSGYLSALSYVPVAPTSLGVHHTDPVLAGILNASLAGGDNDLFLGNLTTSKVRVFHGDEDENVPVWQSRKVLEIIKSYDEEADVRFESIPGKPHWWDGALRTPAIQEAVQELLNAPVDARSRNFTLTVMWPSESGSMSGWCVQEVEVPGRLAKLRVTRSSVHTTNVWAFSINSNYQSLLADETITIDGQSINIDAAHEMWFKKADDTGKWQRAGIYKPRLTGPISRILSCASPLALVVPYLTTSSVDYVALARRMAHNLSSYLSIDCLIVSDSDALKNKFAGAIVFGGPAENSYAHAKLGTSCPVQFNAKGYPSIKDRLFNEPGTGVLFMHDDAHLIIYGTDDEGYERAMRSFPLRTGVPNPEWLVIGPNADRWGSGGILGAGFWDRTGRYSEAMSWLS